MREQSIHFGSFPELSAKWGEPEKPWAAVVFSHPHPLMGGSMSNNVVRLVCHFLNRLDVATLRYDFRGVGESGGEYDQGEGEKEDVLAAVAEARWRTEELEIPLFLVGYSFGSWVNWNSLNQLGGLAGAVFISPPLGSEEYPWPGRNDLDLPISIFIGSADHIAPKEVFLRHLDDLGPVSELEIVDGMDHFWIGYENNLARKIENWIRKFL